MKIPNQLNFLVVIVVLLWFTYGQIGLCDVSTNQSVVFINATAIQIPTNPTMDNNCTDIERTLNKRQLDALVATGGSGMAKSRRKRYVAFPEGSSFSVNIVAPSNHWC